MKVAALLPLLSVSVFASPAQTVLNGVSQYSAADFFGGLDRVLHGTEKVFENVGEKVEQWAHDGKEFIKQSGVTYELVTHTAFSEYRLRVTEPSLCDPTVKQYSGYLDITNGKHLFFWFFESRNSPETADFIYWANGGPGCSSTTGLLFELGPCRIAEDGKNTTYNPHSWNTNANILFLDQPVAVGYSYADDGSKIDRSSAAGEDVYAFYQLFFARFPEYAKAKFHMAAESYGGHYAPNAASIFHRKNKELALAPVPGLTKINLASVILANGITDPYNQMSTIPEFVCDGPYPVYEPGSPQCEALRTKVGTCQRLINACYNFDSRFTCVPAQIYCYGQLMGPLQQLGINLYDVRKKCDRARDGDLCYKGLIWIETWMNDPNVKAALGVNPRLSFQSCNMEVNQAFAVNDDGMSNSAKLLTDIVNEGIRLLVYAGNADAMCNYLGQEKWVADFDNTFHSEFVTAVPTPWISSDTGKVVGEVRSAGGSVFTAGNLTLVTVYEAGHMVPYDQPEAAWDMINKWISNRPLAN